MRKACWQLEFFTLDFLLLEEDLTERLKTLEKKVRKTRRSSTERLLLSSSDEYWSFSAILTTWTKLTYLKVKTGNNNLILHFSSNMVVMFASCHPVDQICQMWLRTVDFFTICARKSILKAKMKYWRKVYSIGLWISLSWDFCTSL